MNDRDSLERLIGIVGMRIVKAFPYKIHTVLTDNGPALIYQRTGPGPREDTSAPTSSIASAPRTVSSTS